MEGGDETILQFVQDFLEYFQVPTKSIQISIEIITQEF